MTDTGITLTLLTTILIAGAIVNGLLLGVAFGDWRAVYKSRQNGPRYVIAVAALRRKTFRACMQVGLIILFGSRAFLGRPASPLLATVVGVLLVFVLTADTIADSVDRHLLRWFLRDQIKP